MSAPLHAMIYVTVKFGWKAEMKVAFKQLRAKLISPRVLTFPDFENASVVETDTSAVAVGVLLA